MFGEIALNKITFFAGKMGAGKTSNSVAALMDFHRRGLPTWSNFPIALEPRTKKPAPMYFEEDPRNLYAMRGGLYIIDEASLVKNNRDFANFTKADLLAFTSVRKLHMTVLVIAQSFEMTDLNIRRVGSFARIFKGGHLGGRVYPFTEYEIDEQGQIIKGEPVEYITARKSVKMFSKEVYKTYDTDYLFGGDPPPMEWASAIGWKYGDQATGRTPAASGDGGTLQPAPLRTTAAGGYKLGVGEGRETPLRAAPPHSRSSPP